MSLLTLEALDANDGDCLLLHHGTAARPAHILIDGGRRAVLATALAPRLDELRRHHHLGPTDTLPIELAVLSHVDADHVEGLLALTTRLVDAKASHEPLPWQVSELWLNDFDDVVRNHEAARIQAHAQRAAPEVQAVAASVAQGRTLRAHASTLAIDVNAEFESGLVARPDDAPLELAWDDLTITVLAPSASEMKAYEREWDRALKAILEDRPAPSTNAAVINAASIVLLVASGKRRLLLTGDAHSEDILRGLEVAGLLDRRRPYHVDVLKLPHHGAEGNCSAELFRRVLARHYVISANGRDGNPDPATLDRLWQARGGDCGAWTLHVTFAAGEIPAFQAWHRAHPGARVAYRAIGARAVSIELGDETLGSRPARRFR